jgi:hypothetical protein
MKKSLIISGILACYYLPASAQIKAVNGSGIDSNVVRPSVNVLPEVVVTALGIKREKRLLTYAI